MKTCAADFIDIHKYRHMVNQNVLKAITLGTFSKAKTLDDIGNLMDYEEKHIFQIDPSQWSPRHKNDGQKRKYKLTTKANLQPGQNPNTYHINMFDISRDLPIELDRRMQDRRILLIKRENKERLLRLAKK
jgi:hypothetical protein